MPDYGIKEFCGSCGAPWIGEIGVGSFASRNNGWCCSSPGFMNSEFCATCMGTGGVDTYTCKSCGGTGEAPEVMK